MPHFGEKKNVFFVSNNAPNVIPDAKENGFVPELFPDDDNFKITLK